MVCREDVFSVGLVEPDGTLSHEGRNKPYDNLDDVLNDVVVAHQGGMPEEQAALYALYMKGNAVAVVVDAPDADSEDRMRAWLDERSIYAPPNLSGGDSYLVGALLPVSRILQLAEHFPGAYLQASTHRGQGVPMLRSQWPQESLLHVKAVIQGFIDSDANDSQAERDADLVPCSADARDR